MRGAEQLSNEENETRNQFYLNRLTPLRKKAVAHEYGIKLQAIISGDAKSSQHYLILQSSEAQKIIIEYLIVWYK